MAQWSWIYVRLQQLGWTVGHTSEGLLGTLDVRRLFLSRCGRVELEDGIASGSGAPVTSDPTWAVTLETLRIPERSLTFDPGSGRWIGRLGWFDR